MNWISIHFAFFYRFVDHSCFYSCFYSCFLPPSKENNIKLAYIFTICVYKVRVCVGAQSDDKKKWKCQEMAGTKPRLDIFVLKNFSSFLSISQSRLREHAWTLVLLVCRENVSLHRRKSMTNEFRKQWGKRIICNAATGNGRLFLIVFARKVIQKDLSPSRHTLSSSYCSFIYYTVCFPRGLSSAEECKMP